MARSVHDLVTIGYWPHVDAEPPDWLDSLHVVQPCNVTACGERSCAPLPCGSLANAVATRAWGLFVTMAEAVAAAKRRTGQGAEPGPHLAREVWTRQPDETGSATDGRGPSGPP